jgi:hypothetical protein
MEVSLNYAFIVSIFFVGTTPGETIAAEANVSPVIEFYGKHGENDYKCEFTLTAGLHKFRNNACPNDDIYSFKIKHPKEGYTLWIENNPNCDASESWARYKIQDPFPMDPTQRMNVDAGYNVPVGQEIVPGIRADSHKNTKQLTGKISCVDVFINNMPQEQRRLADKLNKTGE